MAASMAASLAMAVVAASMIYDHNLLSIMVKSDDSQTAADTSVSLGLIVTELVINALKHAFPENQAGTIRVDYAAQGPNWTLAVADDGVGMPPASATMKAGLGTSIIEALAKRLDAEITVASAKPGTAISVVHRQISAVPNARIV